MPRIEELSMTASSRPSHGWAYVPDTGRSIAAVQPGNRKRVRDAAGHPSAATISAKQQKAIEQRLKELDKENYKDVSIPIPKRDDNKKGRKITQNVRRILGYSRGFGHYLAEEEAAIAAGGGGVAAITALPASVGVPQKLDGRRKGGAAEKETAAATSTSRRTSQTGSGTSSSMQPPAKPSGIVKRERASTATEVEMTDSPAQSKPSSSSPTATNTTTKTLSNLPADPILDKDPLLRTRDLPKMPSDRVMAAILAEPPLSYNAARAGGEPLRPPRYFCVLCGYFGKVRCRKCGERVCGLMECWRGHEAVCSAAY